MACAIASKIGRTENLRAVDFGRLKNPLFLALQFGVNSGDRVNFDRLKWVERRHSQTSLNASRPA
jgi:hypothetical protein